MHFVLAQTGGGTTGLLYSSSLSVDVQPIKTILRVTVTYYVLVQEKVRCRTIKTVLPVPLALGLRCRDHASEDVLGCVTFCERWGHTASTGTHLQVHVRLHHSLLGHLLGQSLEPMTQPALFPCRHPPQGQRAAGPFSTSVKSCG